MLRLHTRRNISLVLLIALLAVTGVVWSMGGGDGLKDGVYAGQAEGFGGPLTAEVTISGGRISDIKINHQDTPFIADDAVKTLVASIIEAQNPNVELVSGATYTSKAVVAAVKEAVMQASLRDGVYTASAEGFGGKLTVKVTISGGALASVEVVEHSETPGISDPAFKEVPAAMVASQSWDVDGVSGATYTSNALKEAVKQALVKASLQDGVYTGSAEGFGGKLTVQVTVAEGAIASVEVLEHDETPGISDPAFNQVPAAIVANQSWEVDVVSGATYTSKAIMAATAAALGI